MILYLSGLRLELVYKICMGLAIPGMVLAVHDGLRSRLNRSHGQFLLTFLVAMLLVLLPKWLGHPEFPAFQMNVADQIGYQSQAWMALHYDYPTIRNMDLETRLATGFGLNMPALITLRPAVTLMLGGFASVVDQPVMIVSYAYLAALQLCVFFASLFVLRNVIELSNGFSLLIALGLTVGIFSSICARRQRLVRVCFAFIGHALCRALHIGPCNAWAERNEPGGPRHPQ